VISLKVTNSHCPGCSLLCGVQMIEREGLLDVEFMKDCDINSGKLCRFGIELARYYGELQTSALAGGREVSYEEAVTLAAKALSSSRGAGVALCTGDATTEELYALSLFADAAGLATTLGLGHHMHAVGLEAFHKTVTHPDVLDHAQMIVLVDIDPAYQYPLLARRLMLVREQGTTIVSIGPEKEHLSFYTDARYPCHPSRTVDALRAFVEHAMPHALYVVPCGMYGDAALTAQVNNICAATFSRALFVTDFANVRGGLALGMESLSHGIDGLVASIEAGDVTSLVLVESPLFSSYLDDARFWAACETLDALVVLQSHRCEAYPPNAIVLPLPPFYQRKGTLRNVCNRRLVLSGEAEGAVAVLRDLGAAMGHGLSPFDAVAKEARSLCDAWYETVATFTPVELPPQAGVEGPCHRYVPNPYLVRGMPNPRSKRVGLDLYAVAKGKERYVIREDVAEDVVFAYEKDPRYTLPLQPYE